MKSYLQRLLELNEYECASYSGRGMMSKTCLSTTTDVGLGHFMGDLMQVTLRAETRQMSQPNDAETLVQDVRKIRSDAMGKFVIYYFPGVEYSEN